MSARYIPIPDCSACPRKDHKGAFGNPAYIPICRATGKELGWTTDRVTGLDRPFATYDGLIPNWCPLPTMPDNPS